MTADGAETSTVQLATTVGRAVATLTGQLRAAGVPTPEVDAELLAAHVLGCSRPRLRMILQEPLAVEAATALLRLGRQRAAREPLQRLVGRVGFRRLTVEVCDDVLIPRPETEVLAGLAIERTPRGGRVVDVGTGTGAVALAVVDEAAPGTVVATDVSAAAVCCARANAERLGLAVDVREGHLLDPVPGTWRGAVDVLASNPPYLTAAQVDAAEPEVRDHEPRVALVAGDDGNEVVASLLTAAVDWLAPGGAVLVELHPGRAERAADLARGVGMSDVAVHRDLVGRKRVLSARR